ncbi:hypothetical protein [Polaromonas sp.]|uniref:hypothetical protein n=1 Tax=Polaromonas sp. TaxID=1869339 RepID=UPI003BB76193
MTAIAPRALLAPVQGPRFDRIHALGLLQRRPQVAPQMLQALADAADRFDSMADAGQQHLRRLILRHRSRWENAACPVSC